MRREREDRREGEDEVVGESAGEGKEKEEQKEKRGFERTQCAELKEVDSPRGVQRIAPGAEHGALALGEAGQHVDVLEAEELRVAHLGAGSEALPLLVVVGARPLLRGVPGEVQGSFLRKVMREKRGRTREDEDRSTVDGEKGTSSKEVGGREPGR